MTSPKARTMATDAVSRFTSSNFSDLPQAMQERVLKAAEAAVTEPTYERRAGVFATAHCVLRTQQKPHT